MSVVPDGVVNPLVRLVVFDMIGTTVQATDAVPQAFAAALAPEGVPVDATVLTRVRGLNKRAAIAALVPAGADHAARSEGAYQRFEQALLAGYGPGQLTPVAGAAEVLRRCRAAGVRTALNTGFERALADHVVRSLGWETVADAVVCGDDVAEGRPAPFMIYRAMERTGVIDVARVAVVGDTTADLEAGHHARAGWNIGVWSGAHDRSRLEHAPHTHLCPSVADVPAILGIP